MKVTLKEIGKQCGVSVCTVSQILNRTSDRYSRDTQERVLACAAKLGYRPNAFARATRRKGFGAVLLLRAQDVSRSYLPRLLLDAVEDAVRARDWHLLTARASDAELNDDKRLPSFLQQHLADGILLNYHQDIPSGLPDMLQKYRMPTVWMNCRAEYDTVYPDDLGGGRLVTEELLKLGHRRIAYVDQQLPASRAIHYSRADRCDGYVAAMEAAGLTPQVVAEPAAGVSRLEHLVAVLSAVDRPTAVIGYSTPTADSVAYAALLAGGLRVPDDLSIASFDSYPRSSHAGPLHSCALIPWREVGHTAVDLLVKRIKRPGRRLKARVPDYSWKPGGTSAPPQDTGDKR